MSQDQNSGAPVTALVPRPAHNALEAYEPHNFDEALRIAATYAASHLLGRDVGSAEAVYMIMAQGAELGILPTTALRSIYVVKGRVFLSSDLLIALCLRRPEVCEYFFCVESTETSATYETRRRGRQNPTRITFTLEDAKRAKLGLEWDQGRKALVESSDSNWAKYPKTMLRHRAAAELARMVYPDIVLGLYCDAEEEDVRQEVDVTPPATTIDTQPEAQESTATAIKRWKAALEVATTTTECNRVGNEIKGRLVKGTQEHAEMTELFKGRVHALRMAHLKPEAQKPQETASQDAEIVVEREPGADDDAPKGES